MNIYIFLSVDESEQNSHQSMYDDNQMQVYH